MIEKIKEYSALISLVAAFVGGWYAHTMYMQNAVKLATETREIALESAKQAIAEQDAKHTTIYNKVIERVRTEVQYRDCKHSPETLSDINKAIEAIK